MATSHSSIRVAACLAALVLFGSPLRAAEPELGAGSTASSPCLCDGGCLGIPPHPPARAFLGPWPARGLGLALGLTAGLGLEARPEGAPSLRGWRNADAAVVGGAMAINLATRLLDSPPGEMTASRWSDCRSGASTLNAVDRRVRSALVGHTLKARANAARISDLTLAASLVSPLARALGNNPGSRRRDTLVLAETLAASWLVNDAAKRLFDRPRPYAHFCEPQDPAELEDPMENADVHYSFYSGHASMSFAAAVAAGTISHYRGDRNERWIWATGLSLAATTGVLRIVADKHYLVDVLVGTAAGGAAGWLIPRLHRPGPTHSPSPVIGGPPTTALAVPLTLAGRGSGVLRAGFSAGPFAELNWHW